MSRKGIGMMQNNKPRPGSRQQAIVTGLILIGLGAIFFADGRGWLELHKLRSYWPAIIGLVGLSQMIGARDAGQFAKGSFLVFLSMWLYASLENLWGLNFHNSWPLILIAVGLSKLVSGLAGPDRGDKSADE
jgi:hypothetical protein